ncbi:MAG: HAD family hydrolase [Cytophagales bacterium]
MGKIIENISLVVLDMAGTTVRDNSEVEGCFAKACEQTGLSLSAERIKSVQGWSKRYVFEVLWSEKLGLPIEMVTERVDHSYAVFKSILEDHYNTSEIVPTEGCLELFSFLRLNGIKIALTTGFYREVTDIILRKLGWLKGLDKNYKSIGNSFIDLSIAGDEVKRGRPFPDMILKAMDIFGIDDSSKVISIGDTPSDLQSGKAAGCFLTLGITNGTHTRELLMPYPNDGLLGSLYELISLLNTEQMELQVC